MEGPFQCKAHMHGMAIIQGVGKGGVWLASMPRLGFFWELPLAILHSRENKTFCPQLWRPVCTVSIAYAVNIRASVSPLVPHTVSWTVCHWTAAGEVSFMISLMFGIWLFIWFAKWHKSLIAIFTWQSLLCPMAQHPMCSPFLFIRITRGKQLISDTKTVHRTVVTSGKKYFL